MLRGANEKTPPVQPRRHMQTRFYTDVWVGVVFRGILVAAMNCQSCGAPLNPVEGRNYFCCTYCHTFHFPTELKDSADRITPLSERSDLECSTCQIPLTAGGLDDVRVVYCEKCRDILVNSQAFAQLMAARRGNYKGAEVDPEPLNPEELNQRRECPQCGRLMEVHPYYGPGNVVIDSCVACMHLWLDHGEIAAIESSPGLRQPPKGLEPPKPVRLADPEWGHQGLFFM